MARTRSEIVTLVQSNTGRTDKGTIINSLCDSALKIAVSHHPFSDIVYTCDDVALTEGNVNVSIASLTHSSGTAISELGDVVTARIVECKKLKYYQDLPGVTGDEISVGDVMTGSNSSATAYIIYVDNTSGTWNTGDASGELWIANKSGTFEDGEYIEVDSQKLAGVDGTDPGAGGSKNSFLKMKNRQWWDRNIVNPEDNQKGWPDFGLHSGTIISLDRPLNDDLTLRLRVSDIPTYSGDDVETPISGLDIFVEQYVTAMVYLSLGMTDKYLPWYMLALGRDYDRGKVGGSLLHAINKDKFSASDSRNVDGGRKYSSKGTTVYDTDNDRTSTWY